MRVARFILVLAALVLAFGFLAPARWFSAPSTSAAPPDITLWVHVVIVAIVLVALFVPGLRPRWGWKQGVGVVRTRSGWRRYKVTARAARMNFLTCYGLAIALVGLILEMVSGEKWAQWLPPAMGMKVGLIGVVIFLVGTVFAGSRGAETKTTWLDTGKTVRRRGYYEED